MVGAFHVGADEGPFEARAQRLRDKEIVNAPADVPGAGIGEGRPPGVMPAAALEFTKGVEEAGFQEGAKAGAFLGRETVVLQVGLRVGEINFGVRHVEVAAEDHRFAAFELLEVTEEVAVPLPPVGQAGEFAF